MGIIKSNIDKEKEYWEKQVESYKNINAPKNKKYEVWQPARWAGNRAIIKRVYDMIGNDVRTSIELGAGSAAFSFELYRKFKNKISGIDKSKVAVEYGKMISQDLGISFEYECGDFFITNKKKYDMVLSLGVIEHYDDEKQLEFVKLCHKISNKYVIFAIPNQESLVFKSYIKWANKSKDSYEEKHNPLNVVKLKNMLIENNFEILLIDGFQILLSEGQFWSDEKLDQEDNIKAIKKAFNDRNSEIGRKFPNYNFQYKDIELMSEIEYNFSQKFRLNNSFMNIILAKKKEN
ncbi:MAG TPA: class I SAM-dependent methyltransferase [Bacilli bacterium]|nr:class I SAM-dependent methyltransferase [Bacilli bacterium]